jgi:hypothetical protein
MVATGVMSHDPVAGKCSGALSDKGRKESNLSFASSSSAGVTNRSYNDHIIGWLIDDHNTPPENVGHRRLIINPFLKSTAYGQASGSHPTQAG